ncbi:MAG: hypothetical protein WA921_13600 [Ahrensia sp.]
MRKSVLVPTVVCLSSFLLQACSTTSQGGATLSRSTAMDRAIGGCIGSVAIGAVGGALVGAAIGGSRAAERGAIIGAAAGIGRCAVLIELAAAEDKQKLREAELAALELDRETTQTIKTQTGKSAKVRTKVKEAPLPPPRRVKVDAPKVVDRPDPAPSATVAVEPSPVSPEADVASSTPTVSQDDIVAIEPAAPVVQASYFEEKQDYTACRFTELIIDMDGQSADSGQQKWCKGQDGAWQPVAG